MTPLSSTLTIVLSASILLGCRAETHHGSYAPVDFFTEGTGGRHFRTDRLDTLWAHGLSDTVLAHPSRIVALSDGDAILLDVRSQRIHRVGPFGQDWSWGTTGRGPREIRNVRAVTVNNNDEILLVDSGNRRLVWLTSTGDWSREIPFPPEVEDDVLVDGVVALGDGRYVLNHRTEVPWTIISETGESFQRIPSPWSGFQAMHPLQTLGEVAAGNGTRWAFGFGLGNGIWVFDGDNLIEVHSYVQHATFPPVVASNFADGGFMLSYAQRPISVAHDMTVHHDTLLVLATSSWVDRYHLSTGEYHGTTILPFTASGVAALGDTLLLIDASGIFPSVTALKVYGDEE